jgi:hypothetical protein
VIHTRTAIEYRGGAGAAVLPMTVDRVAEESDERRRRLAAEQALDQVLADSFPASDPPSWNPGIALLNPAVDVEPEAERSESIAGTAARTGTSGIIDVSRPSSADRTFLQGLVSLAGAAGIALLVPFAILLVGLPIALSIRGVVELFGWLFGVNVR